jgi:hypothetical protein
MSKQQLHKRVSQKKIALIVEKYMKKSLRAKEACKSLNIGRTRFYQLTVTYKNEIKQNIGYKDTKNYDGRSIQ